MIAAAFPTWSGAVLGNAYYRNTPGEPALWITPRTNATDWTGWNAKVTRGDLEVRDAADQLVDTYTLIVADAESTDGAGGAGVAEGLRFSSDKPLEQVVTAEPDGFSPSCAGGLTWSADRTTATCLGGAGVAGSQAGAQVLSVDAPTFVSGEFTPDAASRQAIAFGVQFASVSVTKVFGRRWL